MKLSEKCYCSAMFIAIMVAALADSPNIRLWTGIAVIGIIAATLLVRAATVAQRRGK